jgi:hypothetical protein
MITRTVTNSVVVSWALPADGWVLEWTNRAASVSAPWPLISPPYQTNAAQQASPLRAGSETGAPP